jgi:uncharacterized membrane protein (UPF0127 family)
MSNETPNPNPEKTGSGPSLKKILFYSALAVATIGAGWSLARNDPRQITGPYVELSGHQFEAEVADSVVERTRGLSGRDDLAANAGLLFVFDKDGRYCFWMKDMKFSIDIIWLDKDGKVVHKVPHASPDTYPQEFCPPQEARYAFEVNAGTTDRLSVSNGDVTQIRY